MGLESNKSFEAIRCENNSVPACVSHRSVVPWIFNLFLRVIVAFFGMTFPAWLLAGHSHGTAFLTQRLSDPSKEKVVPQAAVGWDQASPWSIASEDMPPAAATVAVDDAGSAVQQQFLPPVCDADIHPIDLWDAGLWPYLVVL